MTKLSNKRNLLVNGYGQCKFYFGIDPNTNELIVGIDHPEADATIFLTGSVLASINGWIARKQPDLKPLTLN